MRDTFDDLVSEPAKSATDFEYYRFGDFREYRGEVIGLILILEDGFIQQRPLNDVPPRVTDSRCIEFCNRHLRHRRSPGFELPPPGVCASIARDPIEGSERVEHSVTTPKTRKSLVSKEVP